MTREEATQHALGYAAGREDVSGVKTVPAAASMRGPDFGWLDFGDAYAQAQDDFNSKRHYMMTNARDAYDTWQASGGVSIFRET